ncbi:MAG: PorV/PorQ family protein [Candidatus Coatesbacteria bacterium]|jgi:hypothetical protein|nr:PorV/PorQ family protein [Candidatus Coatesbacteria bacterium]
MSRRLLLLFVLVLVSAAAAQGGGPGTSGADFLNLGVGARPMALAGAYAAISDDVYGLTYNPAGLSQIVKTELGSFYANILGDVHHGWIGFAQEAGGSLSFGLDLNLLYANETRRDSYGDPHGEYWVGCGAMGGGLALDFGSGFSLGLAARYVFQKYDTEIGHGFAGDLGLLYHTRYNGFRVGLVAENLGPPVTILAVGDPMPMAVRLGLGTSLFRQSLNLTADAVWRFENTLEADVGIEWWAVEGVAVRAGYRILDDHDSWSGVCLGLGLDALSGLIYGSLDYALVPREPLGYVHRVSYSLKF